MSASPNALFVHAHPDDESLWTGGTIAELTARGAEVDLIVCTWAEGTHRHRELLDATAALGMARPPIMLGYADSFVPESAPGAPRLIDVNLEEQVRLMVGHIRRLRPEVIITYNAYGIYGHPDHIHAHRLAVLAADAAALPLYEPELGLPWQTSSLYFATIPQSKVTIMRGHLTTSSHIPMTGTPDDRVDLDLDVCDRLGAKLRAIYSHVSEMSRSASMKEFAALPREPQRLFLTCESYRRRDLVPGGCDIS
ncbi:PIG-L family deacetylase [Gordonia alkaliphila]|uniref:PIG-L family deacetylase n=1 Tax=Gordonia alkaliphila TaxID=1053547 RepID=A0ABP8Z8Q9_9ACTN